MVAPYSCVIWVDSTFISQVITLNLTHATNGGRIGERNEFQLFIPANDDPHGTVEFASDSAMLTEEQGTSVQTLQLIRRYATFKESTCRYQPAGTSLQVCPLCVAPACRFVISAGTSLQFCSLCGSPACWFGVSAGPQSVGLESLPVPSSQIHIPSSLSMQMSGVYAARITLWLQVTSCLPEAYTRE